MNDGCHLVPEFPAPETYVSPRDVAEMPPRSLATAERGVSNMIFDVRVIFEGATDDEIIGMGRFVGGGGTAFQVVDVVVHPGHQGRGLGIRVMDALVDYLGRRAPPSTFVNLLADVDGYCERWGSEPTAPASKGMSLRVGGDDVHGRDEN